MPVNFVTTISLVITLALSHYWIKFKTKVRNSQTLLILDKVCPMNRSCGAEMPLVVFDVFSAWIKCPVMIFESRIPIQ